MEAALRKAPPFPSRNTKKPPNASGGASVKAGAAAGKKPLPPPGISGTVASLVISPEWFAANPKETVERKWWSPGTDNVFFSFYLEPIFLQTAFNLESFLAWRTSSVPVLLHCSTMSNSTLPLRECEYWTNFWAVAEAAAQSKVSLIDSKYCYSILLVHLLGSCRTKAKLLAWHSSKRKWISVDRWKLGLITIWSYVW